MWLRAALALLEAPDRAGPLLARLAALEVTGSTTRPASRRVALRCAAAAVLAGRGTESSALAHCDPDPHGRAGRLALLRVLDRGPLRAQRLRLFRGLLEVEDAVVRERALELLPRHAELEHVGTLVTAALARKTAGDTATAARLIADHPERVAATPGSRDPEPGLTAALVSATATFAHSSAIEVRAALIDAAGRLPWSCWARSPRSK